MKIHLHKNAKTTPAQRAFIQAGTGLNTAELAKKIGVSQTTVRKWKKRNSVYDRPHTPHKIPAVLSPLQETIVVLLRLCLRSGLDDLHTLVRRFIFPEYARSSLNRCLKRYGISRLEPLAGLLPGGGKDFRGTFLYYSMIRLPDFSETRGMEFLYIFLDCTTRRVYAEFTASSCLQDPCQLIKGIPSRFSMKILGFITGPLIDLDGQAATRIFPENQRHAAFPLDGLNSPGSLLEFQSRLPEFLSEYNTMICQRALKYRTPGQALHHWYKIFPGSFRTKPE